MLTFLYEDNILTKIKDEDNDLLWSVRPMAGGICPPGSGRRSKAGSWELTHWSLTLCITMST